MPGLPGLVALAVLAAAGCCPKRPIQPPPMGSCQRTGPAGAHRIPLGLKLTLISGRTRKPASVQMLFRARVMGKPYSGLKAADLVLAEETVAARKDLGRPLLLPLGAAAMTQTLVLVDLTGELRSEARRRVLQARLRTLTRRLLGSQAVAVAAFDGGASMRVLQSFTHDPAKVEAALNKLPTLKSRDPSRNLNGAVAEALGEIELYGAQAAPRFELSSLLVITAGPDLADRTKMTQLRRSLGSHHRQGTQLFALGLGPWAGKPVVSPLGRTAALAFRRMEDFDDKAAKRLAATMRSHVESHFVLSHCSTRRQGNHRLVLQTRNKSVSLSYDYDAYGFKGGCNASALARSCKVIQCGGPVGSPCHGCDGGKLCYHNRCLPANLAREFLTEDRSRRLAALRAAKLARARQADVHRRCLAQRSQQQDNWRAYRLNKRRYVEADCGFRAMVELGSRAYPVPKGVAGAVLAGWSLGRWLELHGGLGFSTEHAVGLAQARVKLFRYRILELMVVPRFGAGGSKHTLLINAELLLGVRVKLGRYLGLYANVGPGFAYAREHALGISKMSFVLPFWLGAELRL